MPNRHSLLPQPTTNFALPKVTYVLSQHIFQTLICQETPGLAAVLNGLGKTRYLL